MRIQLIHPPVFVNARAFTALRPSPPLGLAYVAAALEEEGHEVRVLDALAEGVDQVLREGRFLRVGLDVEEIVARVDPRADWIGISGMWSFSWPLVRRLLHALRARFPHTPLVGGGEHFTGLAEHSLREAPLDVVVLGEGEETVVELCRALASGRELAEVEGLVVRSANGELERTRPRARIRDVDRLPRPAWQHFDLALYHRRALLSGLRKGNGTVPILATRGCPYRCTYCSSPKMWTTRWVARNPIAVVDEIEHYVREFGADNFPFQDLTAILDRRWIVTFCEELLRRGLDIHWQLPSGTRCEVVDEEVASLLRRTGGAHLAFAPESGSEATRQRIRKQMKRDKLLDAVRAAVDQRLSLTAFFVLGFPDDEPADLRESARMARRLAWMGVTDVAVGYFFPLPNTELYHQLHEQGRIQLDDRFLEAPIRANEPFLAEENNYCAAIRARQLSWSKWWIVFNFYALSFLVRPWRVARVALHTLRGVETAKLETYLIERLWRRGRLRETEAPPAPVPATVEGTAQRTRRARRVFERSKRAAEIGLE